MVGANVGVSMPVFWLGLMLQFLFAVALKDTFFALPPSGRLSPARSRRPSTRSGRSEIGIRVLVQLRAAQRLLQMAVGRLLGRLPAPDPPRLALATIPTAIIARMTRSSLLDTLGLDYVRTARAKGLNEGRW